MKPLKKTTQNIDSFRQKICKDLFTNKWNKQHGKKHTNTHII